MEEAIQTYLVKDAKIPDQQFIVKQLHPETKNPQNLKQLRQSFFKEAKILKQLGQEHDKIQKTLAYFEVNKEFYLVQEFIYGHQLTEEILLGFPLKEDQVIDLLLEILQVLLFVHDRNIIHQDIKPASIIRRHSDNKLVLVDFGSVQEIVTTIVGDIEYIPIEQLQGQPQYNSDIYALGITAIAAIMGLSKEEISSLQSQKNLLTGEIVWHNRNIKVSREFTQIINKMVRFNYHKRYQSVTEVLQDIQQLKNYQHQPQKPQYQKFRLTWVTIAFIVMLVAWFWQFLKPAHNEQFLYQEGLSKYERGNYQEAVDNFTQTIKINPQNSLAYNYRSDSFYRLGEYEKAQADSSQAITLNPQDANAYYDRGFAWFGLGKYKEAIADYTQAIKLNSQKPYAYYGRGLAQVKVKHYQSAVEDFSKAIALNPNFDLAYYHRGLIHAKLGKKKSAIADFEKAAQFFQNQGDKNSYKDTQREIQRMQK
ncbi:tetratricopeptide repeat protein [Fortiea sp. LEGE XX443]|nr:tetratricopeptide repeat protein [Fortiea sp. LEGE XX443]